MPGRWHKFDQAAHYSNQQAGGTHMQAQFFDFYRSGIRTAAELAKTSLENTARLQQKQLDMVRTILDENSRSSDRLGDAKSFQDLIGLQSQLAQTQMQRIAEFWTSAWQLAAENQKAVMEQWQSHAADATRSSEEIARVAAAQISRATGSVREAAPQQQHERQAAHRRSAWAVARTGC